MISNSLD